MSEKKLDKRRYNARVEYRAVQKEVEALIAEGHRARALHEDLVAAGRLTISYSSFCDYLRGHGERQHGGKKNQPPATPPTLPKPSPRFSKKEPESSSGFVHERNVDLKDLI